jgi:hypothetical protein
MSRDAQAWSIEQLEESAAWIVQEVPAEFDHRFAVVSVGDDLYRFGPEIDEDYLTFVDRAVDTVSERNGDGLIVAWKWPERAYVSVTVACPAGVKTIAIYPRPWELN